jgi:hypothetical protein
MIAPLRDHAAYFLFRKGAAMNDRISDLACARISDRDRRAGGNIVSAEVIRLIPRPRRGGEATDFPTIAFRFAAEAEDHPDTAPCEYVAPQDEV